MEKTLGELFDYYSQLYVKYQDTKDESDLEELNIYKDIISDDIGYLSSNLELNLLVNYVLRANKEIYESRLNIEEYKDDLIEESEVLAINGVTLVSALKLKEKFVKKIDEFIEGLDEHRL